MQRTAYLAFIGVVLLLTAFTVQQSGKQKAARACSGKVVETSVSDTVLLASSK